MGLFSNPLGYAGYPPEVTGTPQTQNSTVRAATEAEALAGTLESAYISPATAEYAMAADFASPPALGFGSTTPRPVHATTLEASGNVDLGSSGSSTSVDILNEVPAGAVDRTANIIAAASGRNDTVNVLSGLNTTNAHVFNLLSGDSSGGTGEVNIFTGALSGGTHSFNMFDSATAGTLSVNVGTCTKNVTASLFTGTGANVIAIGGATSDVDIMNQAATAARTLDIMTVGSDQQENINIFTGIHTAGSLHRIRMITGNSTAGTNEVLVLTGDNTGNTNRFSVLTTCSGGTNEVKIGTCPAAVDVQIGNGAGANAIAVGGAASTSTVLGTVNINASGAGVTTIGTGGTGATNIGNATGNTLVTGSLTATTSLTATLGAITATNGNIVRGTAGNKDVYTSVAATTAAGANSAGTVTLVGGTATISTTAVTASSIVRMYRQGIGATGAAAQGILTLGAVVAGTSFVINSVQAADATALQVSDVSVVAWEIVN